MGGTQYVNVVSKFKCLQCLKIHLPTDFFLKKEKSLWLEWLCFKLPESGSNFYRTSLQKKKKKLFPSLFLSCFQCKDL